MFLVYGSQWMRSSTDFPIKGVYYHAIGSTNMVQTAMLDTDWNNIPTVYLELWALNLEVRWKSAHAALGRSGEVLLKKERIFC